MANVKITELTNLTDPSTTDVMPVVDVDADVTKKVSVGEVVGKISGDVDVATDGTSSIAAGVIVDADVNANAEIAVSKLADGTARQLLQTDAAGTGVEWTSNVDVPGTLDVTGAATLDTTLDVDGQSTLASAAVSDLTENRVVIAGASGELEDSANLTFDGSELTVSGDLTVTGDLIVEGATTTLETQTVTVEDKNIEIGVVGTPTDTTADGGGITLKGATDKTINWVDATDAWTSSEHIELASGKEFYIDGNGVLNATTLGSGVVNSSLTSVGTIATGTWEGDAIDAAYLDAIVVTTSDTGTVTSAMILDNTIVNDDINASAAIAGTKIDPDFGSQTVETTGDLAINTDVLFVDSSESAVGIGTTSPVSDAALTLSTDSDTALFFRRGSGSNQDGAIRFEGGDFQFLNGANSSTVAGLSERVRIDNSGRLLVGTPTARTNVDAVTDLIGPRVQVEGTDASGSSLSVIRNTASGTTYPRIYLGKTRGGSLGANTIVQDNDGLGELLFNGADGTNLIEAASIKAEVDGTPGANDMPGRLVLSTTANGASSPTERMMISNTGTTTLFSTVVRTLEPRTSASAGTTNSILECKHSATGIGSAATLAFRIWSNGDAENINNSYNAISDSKLKENIVDAGSQWSDIKSLQVRTYNFKEETGHQTHTQIGLIAQELELTSPGLVTSSPDLDDEGNDLGTVTKGVKYSVLYMKAIKALQEAMERIETLEAKVAALEAQ